MQTIAPGTVLRLEQAAGTCIVVRSGRVWITETGQTGDVGLDAGQSYRIAGRGRVLVEPLGRPGVATAVLSLVPAARTDRGGAGHVARLLSRLGLRLERLRP